MYNSISSPEFQLILSCCRLKDTVFEKKKRLGIIRSGINNALFLELVDRHRISPLVYLSLKDFFQEGDYLLNSLRKSFEENRLKALTLKGHELWLTAYLNTHHFKFTFLKGLHIAEKYYGDLASRHVLDIDIVVEKRAVKPLNKALTGVGFYPEPDLERFNFLQQLFFRAVNHDQPYIQQSSFHPTTIEVHWRFRGLLEGFSLNEIRDLDPVEEFLYICTHGTEHAWFRLKWLSDVIQIIESVEFDWLAVRERALALQCLTHLEITWKLVNELFKIPIPQPILSRLPPSSHKRKLKYIFKSIQDRAGVNENAKKRIAHFIFILGFKKRLSGFPLILKYLTGPEDWKLLPLPPFLFWLYIPLRPFLFLWRKLTFPKRRAV